MKFHQCLTVALSQDFDCSQSGAGGDQDRGRQKRISRGSGMYRLFDGRAHRGGLFIGVMSAEIDF